MKLKEIYLENQVRRYSSINKIKKENIKLDIDPIKKIKNNWIILLAMFVIIIAMLLLNFNLSYFIVSIGLIFTLVIVFIFGNKSTLLCDKNTLNVKQGFQNINIPYNRLKNVYIGKVSGVLFFLPAMTYNIIIRYEDNFSFLRELEFSLFCADTKEVNDFINNFLIEEKVEERYVRYEKRKIFRRLLSTLITVILAVGLLIYFLPKCGINLLP
ncbi:MAG: hypothetical protein J6K42_05530 [Clostridia bacterium]|nr:hypothetical protein [Clostridia bacterium]